MFWFSKLVIAITILRPFMLAEIIYAGGVHV